MSSDDSDGWLDFIDVKEQEEENREEKDAMNRYFGLDEKNDEILMNLRSILDNVREQEYKINDEHGSTFQIDIAKFKQVPAHRKRGFVNNEKSRFCVVHIPQQPLPETPPILFFFHGLVSSAWCCALASTSLRELANRHKFIAVFAQAQGPLFDSPFREKWGCIACGDTEWEIRNPKQDYEYISEILDVELQKYNIHYDANRVYFWGYSNGAMFSSNLTVHFGGTVFAAGVNMMGGWAGGYEDTSKLEDVTKAIKPFVPIYIISGTADTYLPSAKRAQKLFTDVGIQVTFEVLDGCPHRYVREHEEKVWKWLSQFRKPLADKEEVS